MKPRILLILIALTMTACSAGPVFDLAPKNTVFSGATYNNKVDVLWVIDSSTSMRDSRASLSSQIPRMINIMNSKKLDYRMASVTMDMARSSNSEYSKGVFIGSTKVITNKTPNQEVAFRDMLMVPFSQSILERGLLAMKTALGAELLATKNKDFFRDDSLLAVIFVSNEDDGSQGDWSDYKEFLDSIKAPLENGNTGWLANFIGVINPDGTCETIPGFSDTGSEYMALARSSGGSISSICEGSLATSIENIQRTIISIITEWKLEAKPDLSTIKVKMNGVLIPEDEDNGWTYNAKKNAIVFHGNAVPASDIKIEVDYKPIELD